MEISCVICAYNEAPRIGAVLEAVCAAPSVSEIIVIDDGSTDGTADVVRKFPRAKLLINERNSGKTRSFVRGLKEATHDMVVAIDADLLGLTPEAIEALIAPVANGDAHVTLSMRKNSLGIYKLLGVDFVSGERVFDKKLLLEKEEELMGLAHFGLEVFMNREIIERGHRLRVVDWADVESPRKSVKQGFWKGTYGDIRMIGHIHNTIPLHRCFIQMLTMRKRSREQ